MFLWDGEFVANGVCSDKIYIFELSSRIDKLAPKRNRVWLVICILPKPSRFLYVPSKASEAVDEGCVFAASCLSDANIRENWYPNVVLSGRTTMFLYMFDLMKRNRRLWLHPR